VVFAVFAVFESRGCTSCARKSRLKLDPLLTSEGAVDDQLRRMNATFVASLEMLGSPRRRERTRSSPGPGPRNRDLGSPGLRVERISEITEEASGSASTSVSDSASANQNSREGVARAHIQSLLSRPRPGSRTDSITSQEVIGKLELDERRQGMGQWTVTSDDIEGYLHSSPPLFFYYIFNLFSFFQIFIRVVQYGCSSYSHADHLTCYHRSQYSY